jgi:hypothetical protein
MRLRLLAVVTGVLCACAIRGHAQVLAGTSTVTLRAQLRLRADSLERLDPATEAAAALGRADRRFIGLQGYVRFAPGVAPESAEYPDQDAMRVIEGTSDGVWAPEVERLNHVAAAYAERYNRVLLLRLRKVVK